MNQTDIDFFVPPMLFGEELRSALASYPRYDENIRNESQSARLMALSDLYDVYVPSAMSEELYSKLYLALIRSLHKKHTVSATKQQYENRKAILQNGYRGIMGGSDSFTVIGASGIGKSSAISRAITLISVNGIIISQNPYAKIIPIVVVQCPFDASVKGLLLEILRKVDEMIGSLYYANALRTRATTDMLIGSVSQAALNHIGLLVVDEIQHVVNAKNGKSLVGMLTQLINNSGISICMVGTPECTVFFEQAMQLARRSLGLQYGSFSYDSCFYDFCRTVFSYQYVASASPLTDSIVHWLYEHSAGIASVVVSLLHDAQEIAILTGKETLDIETLNEAYQKRLSLLHTYMKPSKVSYVPPPKREILALSVSEQNKDIADSSTGFTCSTDMEYTVSDLAAMAKAQNLDIVSLLKEHFSVMEVRL